MTYIQCPSCHKILNEDTKPLQQHRCGLGRKRKKRQISRKRNFPANIFKPQGVPLKNNKLITLSSSEMEAIRLKNLEGLQQTEIAEKMSISQSTLARILRQANKKIAIALVGGYALKINNK